MTRDAVAAMLGAHSPADAKEAADLHTMLELLDRLTDPFSAQEPEAHFTASALVLDGARGRTCLVLHRKLDLWLQPGGHVEPDDSTLALAALREVKEETGLSGRLDAGSPVHLDIHEIPDRADRPAHLHLDVRFRVVADGVDLTLSEESTDVRWWTLAEATRAGDESLARLIRAATV